MFGASLLDVAPTVLALLGLPVARDMEGRVLPIFAAPVEPEFIETYETAGGREEASGETGDEDPWAAQEALKQLVALGYVEAPPENAAKAVEVAEVQKLANLAEVHLAKREPGKAAALLEELLQRQPKNSQAKLQLAQCRLSLGEIEGCQKLVDEVFKDELQSPWALNAYGLIEFARGKWTQALEHFRQAAAAAPALPQIQRQIGATCLRLGKLAQAEAAFRKSLDLEGDNPATYDSLGMALYRQKKYAEAEECFLRSLGCLYHQPLVQFHLGIALAAQGKLTPAVQSLQRALEFNPNLKEAHKVLIKVYRAQGHEALAHYHKTKAQELPDQGEAEQDEA